MNKKNIHTVAIYPPIGIARIGNSPEHYLASEIPGATPDVAGGFKDDDGRVKKQVPLFRVYAFDSNNEPLGELTADDCSIEWTVHVANRKAGWYQFNNALDLGALAIPSSFRNENITGDARQGLVIDPGARKISGKSLQGAAYKLDTGTFLGKPVALGELRTDDKGRLLFFGGDGLSEPHIPGTQAITFANNDGWHDDVSDGTVRATVSIDGVSFEAEPAVVVCTPPNFGQGLFSPVTMRDVAYDLFIRSGWLKGPEKITYWEHIHPILERMCSAQWVNAGFFMLFGVNSESDFSNPDLIKVLSNPAEKSEERRMRVFNWFRNFASPNERPEKIPPYYGDLFGDYENKPQVDLSITETQYSWLQAWAKGDFTTGKPAPVRTFEELSLTGQLDALNCVGLEECLGGPFHPGIEITWTFRQQILWARPWRLKVLPASQPVGDDYGPVLDGTATLAANGPLDGSGPGSLTRWMGIPWQTDEASCLSGYNTSTFLPLPSFWAARVPNHVMPAESYQRLLDPNLNIGQKLKHLSYRVNWLRDIDGSYQSRINKMVSRWHELGIIVLKPGAAGKAGRATAAWACAFAAICLTASALRTGASPFRWPTARWPLHQTRAGAKA